MQNVDIFKGRSLGGTSDLTLLARLKPGFIDSLESVTYKTRTKRVLDALHASRGAAHEYAPARLLSDSIERVAVIQSVRVAVFDDPEQVMLSVSFDGPWESYIRILWQKVGSLLDLIFCGTEDYVVASENTFEAWLGWARRVQVETGFFYGPPSTTARDVVYLRRLEIQRATHGADERFDVGFATRSAEAECAAIGTPPPDLHPMRVPSERVRAGLQGMVALYRLADLHLPDSRDGRVLRRAARSLLDEFVALLGGLSDDLKQGLQARFARPLAWLNADPGDPIPRPGAPQSGLLPDGLRADVQAGILRGYGRVTHGAVLLLHFGTPDAAAGFIAHITPMLTRDLAAAAPDAPNHDVGSGEVVRNLSFTMAGLRALGMHDKDVSLLPDEFRQGMKARAGLLGDIHTNHPRRWQRPPRWGATPAAGVAEVPVELDTVHAVLQLRTCAPDAEALAAYEVGDPGHPLAREIDELAAREDVEVLAVQPLRRQYVTPDTFTGVREHFGFVDGGGNPDVLGIEQNNPANRVHLGEVLLGHANAADAAPTPASDTDGARRLHWLANGTFLVMRKYRQDVARLYAAATQASKDHGGTPGRDEMLAKMMGRTFAGAPLAKPGADPQNAFDYQDDPRGERCPLQAHVRRANPREAAPASPPGARTPRIVRRSMSYGRPYNHGRADDPANAEPRGLLFMAYNASLGEQFEVVQRWIVAGNSTGGYSGHSCPVLGVPEPGHTRSFRFLNNGSVVRMALDGTNHPFDDAETFTALEWGCYLFVPSFTVLERLLTAAREATAVGHLPAPWDIPRGAQLIRSLPPATAPAIFPDDNADDDLAVQAWKRALEDADATDRLGVASIWAAVRAHGGVLRTPYGVLVGTRELAKHVLLDAHDRYSIVGQHARMKECFGSIYLGLDDTSDGEYWRLSRRINTAIMDLVPAVSFERAKHAAQQRLALIQRGAMALAGLGKAERFDSSFDGREVVDEVLAVLAEDWFGLQNAPQFQRGGVDWSWRKGDRPSYPGHFTAISRYMFQPHPSATVRALAQDYGAALRVAMREFVETVPPSGVLAAVISEDPAYAGQHDLIGRTMVGVLMGFIPTVAGAILNTLREWLTDGTFWRLRAEVLALGRPLAFEEARDRLRPPMNEALTARPMPPQLWRSAVAADTLGSGPHAVAVAPGERIIIGTGSCLQQGWLDGEDHDSRLMFGGKRTVDPHPTHACPGYHAAIAAMVGTLSAFLELPLQLRSGASPLQLVLEGPNPPAPAPGATPSPGA